MGFIDMLIWFAGIFLLLLFFFFFNGFLEVYHVHFLHAMFQMV